MDQYLLTAFLILVLGYHIDSYLGLAYFKILVRGITALLFLLAVLKTRSRVYLVFLVLGFVFLFSALLPVIPPYEDQLELNLYRKTMMACSSFKEIYASEVENSYAYLPATLYCQLPFVIWGIDIRYLYLILFLISALLIYNYCPCGFKIFLPTIFLFYPELFLSTLNAETFVLPLFGYLLMLFMLPLRKQFPLAAAFSIALGFSFRPQVALVYPFLLIYLIWKKEYKFTFLTISFYLIFMLPGVLNPWGFYRSIIWRQGCQLPDQLWSKYHTCIAINAQGMLVALGFNPELVWNKIPWYLIQVLIYLGGLLSYLIFLRKGKIKTLYQVLLFGTIVVLLFLFSARKLRVFPLYYTIVFLPLLLWSPKKLASDTQLMGKRAILLKIILAGFAFLLLSHYFIGKHYQRKWTKRRLPRKIEFKEDILEDNLNYSPGLYFSMRRGYGFMNESENFALAFYLPRGKFLVKVYTDNGVYQEEVEVKYYIFRIPIYPQPGGKYYICDRFKKIYYWKTPFRKITKVEFLPVSS
jgi:hypothetical protein